MSVLKDSPRFLAGLIKLLVLCNYSSVWWHFIMAQWRSTLLSLLRRRSVLLSRIRSRFSLVRHTRRSQSRLLHPGSNVAAIGRRIHQIEALGITLVPPISLVMAERWHHPADQSIVPLSGCLRFQYRFRHGHLTILTCRRNYRAFHDHPPSPAAAVLS